jgi:UDP-N-acetylglucosamine acyltransferase
MTVHPTAVVDSTAELGEGVYIGPFCVVGPHSVIGNGTRLESHVVVESNTHLGSECHVRQGAVLGGPPQDHKYRGERSYLLIGDRNIIREFVTIHRATGEGEATRIGNDNMIMAYCHIGHNAELGNGIMMANQVGMSGHCLVEDRVVFGGIVGVHQFVRIGKFAMIGGMSKVVTDVPPFMMVDGRPTEVVGLNVLGLRRAGIPPKVRSGLKQAFRLLYRSGLNLTQGIEAAYNEVDPSEDRDYLLEFLTNIRRGYAGRQNDPNRPRPKPEDS